MSYETLFDPFLTQYFLLEAVCASFLTESERHRMFRDLAAVFCLNKDGETEEYYRVATQAPFEELRDLSAYERLCRTVEFARRSGQEVELTDRDRVLLARKREALEIKNDLFRQAKNLTRQTVSDTLLSAAENGNVHAMTALSFLEYHGICLCKDRENALRRIRCCARWNSLFGILMGLAYGNETEKYMNVLGTVLTGAGRKDAVESVGKIRGEKIHPRTDPEARLMEKAFALGVANRKHYDRAFAKIAFSPLISPEDKGKLLLTKQKDAVAALSDIPFDASVAFSPRFDGAALKDFPLKREEEFRQILRNVAVAEKCSAEVCAPLMICARDAFVANAYADALRRGFGEDTVVEADGATLTERDFAGSGEHLLLRGISETKKARTVFLIRNCEEMSREVCEELEKLLDYGFRKKFKLFQPPVSLDLSGAVFLLTASGRTPQVTALARHCDTLWAAGLGREEKTEAVREIFRSRAMNFGGKITLDKEGREYLAQLDPDRVPRIVDKFLRRAIFENVRRIPLSLVKETCEECNTADAPVGFGYRGGIRHA